MFNRSLLLEDRMAMGERLRAARYVAELSIRELAEKLKVSAHTVQNWERGQIPRDPRTRAELCEVLNVDEAMVFAEFFAKIEEARAVIAS
jgi:transcriptional regulator with XRE-family HTH domain